MIVWLDGSLLPEQHARVSPLDRGVLSGFGVFESLRSYDGVPFAWRRHLERLRASADALGIATPGDDTLRAAGAAVLEANSLSDARVRITVTAGPGRPGVAGSGGPPTVMVVAWPVDRVPPTAEVVIAPWVRSERGALAGIKSISYADSARAVAHAQSRGAHEAIWTTSAGDVCEGATSNVFLVEGDRVVTSPLSTGCLAGVTRALVLSLCGDLGVDGVEEARPVDALAGASEAFITSSIREVLPVAGVDGRSLPAAPGPVTAKIAEAYRALVRRNPDP